MKQFLRPYVTHLNRIERKLPKIAKDIVKENADDIIDILKLSQLGLGIRSDGSAMGDYSRSTQGYANADPKWNRKKMKPFGEPYNFEWSGVTFANLKIAFPTEDTFNILTKKGKQELLESIYGETFDLTDEFNEWVNDVIILQGLEKYILGNMFPVI